MNPVHELARPFPQKYVHDDGRGNSYVPHHVVTQRLIHIFGVPPKIEVVRELYDEGKLTGVVMRLTVPGPDYNFVVEEAGEADNPQSKTNGARAKDACSDAIKRCAMRLGLGLSLWAQKDYFLFDALTKETADEGQPKATAPRAGENGTAPADTPTPKKADHPVRPVSEAKEVTPPHDETGEGLSEEGRSSPVLVAKRMQVKILLKDNTPDNIDSLSEKELEALIGKHSKGGKK